MTKHTLKNMILNVIDNSPRGYSNELAAISGYSSGSNLKKVLLTSEKEFDSFYGLLKLVRFLFSEDEQILLSTYSKTIDPCNKLARVMLEYLCNNRILDSMSDLIDRMIDCNNKESREFAKVYKIQYEWQTNYYNLDIKAYFEALKEVKSSNVDLNVFIKLLITYGYYNKKNHVMTFELSQEIIHEIDDIKDDYLKDIYSMKLNEVLSYIYLRVQNNPKEARRRATEMVDSSIGKTHKAYAHYILGCSYLYESYDNSQSHFTKSIAIYKEINREKVALDVEEVSQLANIIWDKDNTSIIINSEYEMYWIIKNNLSIPFELDKEKIDTPYYYLLKGMKENNVELLMQSMIHFLKRGDSFYGQLPKMELLKRNYSQVVIDELINLYRA